MVAGRERSFEKSPSAANRCAVGGEGGARSGVDIAKMEVYLVGW